MTEINMLRIEFCETSLEKYIAFGNVNKQLFCKIKFYSDI